MKTEKMREWRMKIGENQRKRRVIEVYLLHQTTFHFLDAVDSQVRFLSIFKKLSKSCKDIKYDEIPKIPT